MQLLLDAQLLHGWEAQCRWNKDRSLNLTVIRVIVDLIVSVHSFSLRSVSLLVSLEVRQMFQFLLTDHITN